VIIRPSDAAETVVGWEVALERRDGPTLLVLSRQNLPVFDRAQMAPADGLRRGGYVLRAEAAKLDLILIATGSEVEIALKAGDLLAERGVATRVVALPSWELFEAQDAAYRESVLPAEVTARVSIEAGSTFGWRRYVGDKGVSIGVDRFGASAPAGVLYEKFGLTAEHAVEEALGVVAKGR
jgi:transketolase